jgi:hypothetical protein
MDPERGSARFDQRQIMVRNKFRTHTDNSKMAHSPQSGTYDHTYMENGEQKSGTATFTFTELEKRSGYKISGKVVNTDGSLFVIKEGNVCGDGKNAYWIDVQVTEFNEIRLGGVSVINDGKFNFESNVFFGRRMNSNGTAGTYYSFALSDKNTQQPVSEQSIPQVNDLQGKPEDLFEAQPAPSVHPVGVSPSINDTSDNVPSSDAEKPSLFDTLNIDLKK